MPKGVPLDGEIFVGRAAGHSAIPALKASPKARGWRSASFRVFDYPGQAPFSERYEALLRFEAKLDPKCRKIIKVVRQKPVTSGTMLKRVLRQVLAKGGEGVVLTAPQARWAARQKIKIKGLQDMEARIVGYKLTVDGTMKSVHVKHDKVSFFVGIGFTKQERKDFRRLYPVGSWLKVAFERYSHRGVPLKPRAIGLRHKEDMV
jgi:ATP-dependent DNA ligase